VINENMIQRTGENKYVLEPFKKEDRSSHTLADAQRERLKRINQLLKKQKDGYRGIVRIFISNT
jgi:hypothetical protein